MGHEERTNAKARDDAQAFASAALNLLVEFATINDIELDHMAVTLQFKSGHIASVFAEREPSVDRGDHINLLLKAAKGLSKAEGTTLNVVTDETVDEIVGYAKEQAREALLDERSGRRPAGRARPDLQRKANAVRQTHKRRRKKR